MVALHGAMHMERSLRVELISHIPYTKECIHSFGLTSSTSDRKAPQKCERRQQRMGLLVQNMTIPDISTRGSPAQESAE